MTLKFEIKQAHGDGRYAGKFYVFHKNRLGIATLWLRRDGTMSPETSVSYTDPTAFDQFYFDSQKDAEEALRRFRQYA